MIAVEIGFGILAVLGLFAATSPEVFVRYFLADWQRQRLGNNMGAVSWTGWVICAFGLLTAIMAAIADVLRR